MQSAACIFAIVLQEDVMAVFEHEILVERPARWDVPFGADMGDADVARLLSMEPFCRMAPHAFPAHLPLEGILHNDTRIMTFDDGQLIVREGDYGNSAFLILSGTVRVVLQALAPELLGHPQPARPNWIGALASIWKNPQRAEVRRSPGANGHSRSVAGDSRESAGIFLQDIPRILDANRTAPMGRGEFFGELAALSRTPRTATVFADGNATLLEIRWQGLRDLMRHTDQLRDHIERLYRENSLRVHLRETPLFCQLPAEAIERIATATTFATYGNFDWQTDFGKFDDRDVVEQLAREPVIVEEGKAPDGLILIRSGFARVSHRYGASHRTVAYLGKGGVFGMRELAGRHSTGRDVPLRHSLRAVGYVDVLRIPTDVVLQDILPHLPSEKLASFEPLYEASPTDHPATNAPPAIDARTLDFLVDHRLVNGTQTMLIDLERCTRCDDCVRACASTHDNNPRFIRHGPQFDRWMFANACMHCIDPVCMIGCPTGAIAREPTTGTVRINDSTCIGCGTCAGSCPYSAIRMVEIRDSRGAFFIDQQTQLPVLKATKCDLCADSHGGPACQNACPHNALVRMDMNDLPRLANWLDR
jgi:Fe-S-cluster-containing dehydrogenase component/CRP-like cAMP-binding protein